MKWGESVGWGMSLCGKGAVTGSSLHEGCGTFPNPCRSFMPFPGLVLPIAGTLDAYLATRWSKDQQNDRWSCRWQRSSRPEVRRQAGIPVIATLRAASRL